MQWYWEAGHFKKELGERVLERILGDAQAGATDDLGVELTTANVAEQTNACREGLATMRERFPELAREVAELSRSVNSRRQRRRSPLARALRVADRYGSLSP